MGPVWLLLLLPLLLRAQETPDPPTVTVDAENNSTDSGSNSTGPPELPPTSLRPSEPAATPSAAPTEPEDDWTPAETFMYTGDPLTLAGGRCSRAYSPPPQTGSLPATFSGPLRPALNALASTANFLNMIFQASDLRESTVQEDMEWYQALVRALLEADRLIQRALLTFDADPTAEVPQLVLRASRNPTPKVQTIILQDLSKAWQSLHPPAPAPDDSWFRRFKFPESNQPMAALSKRVLLNDLSTLDTPKWRQGDSYVTNHSGVRWAGAPFLDCKDGRFTPGWMLTLSTSFYGLKPDLTPEFRGVIRVDVKIQDIDLDQCATGDSWFADTHQCNRTTMECVSIPGRGYRLGQYCCRCKDGYYNPDVLVQDPNGGPVNTSADGRVCYPNLPICLPCWPGCRSCQDGAPCWVQEAWLLRAAVLAVQGVFMLLIFVSMLVAYRHRRNRRIRASGLLLLETILFGSLLLYFPVFIMYFKPSTFRCILLRWVRMLGFSIVYGTVTLKMYRVLKVFLSRTAQRVPYMSSLHLLRILGVMLMTVSWFLCAWTVGVLQNRDRNIPVFITTSTSAGQGFNLCYLDRWDYMMAVAELLFLCWGSSLWTAVRPVPSAFHEPRYMGIAIHNELLLSTMFHLFRFTFPSLHPDWMLLLSFTHTHVTITVTLALLFIPKFLHVSKPGREEIAAEVYEDEVDLRRSGSYLNSSFHSAWSEPSVDPEDFRDELKKLYAQLEVHKTKKMAANNPHLSKKRSSRCALGRSIIRRIAEIPETVSRQCSREDRDGSFHSRRVNQSDSFRTAPDSISYKSSIKSPAPSLRKSLSDHEYVRERNASLRDSFLDANSVKRHSRRSDTDSLDIPPGVCKSASAQNLTIDTNLLHPDHTRLHKSWSLTSSTLPSMENVTKVNRASTVLTQSKQSISIGDQTRSALQSESYDKAEVCPWEVEQEHTEDKNQKHVTYASAEDVSEKGPPSSEVLICPWDHVPPPEKKPPPEDKVSETEMDSTKKQLTVSASVPGSPRPKVTKDQRVFSFRNPTSKWLSVKSVMGSMDSGGKSGKDPNKEDSVSQKSQDSSSTPKSGASSRHPSTEKKSLQKRSLTTADAKPCLVKQNAIRLSSGDSSDRSPRRLVIVKSAVYPWDVDDMQKDGTYENVFLSGPNSKRSSVSSWETTSGCRTPSTHRRGSNRIAPARNVTHADICPWEETGEGQQRQQSIKADVCPWESQVSEQSNICPWESQEHANVKRQGSGRSDVCPWETKDVPVIYHTSVSRDSQTQQSSDICPWEAAEPPKPVNVCPWEAQDKAEAVYENINPMGSKGSLSVPLRQEPTKAAVYPGASKQTGQQHHEKPPAMQSGIQATKTTESCPWEFPDPPTNLESICPWEDGSTVPTNPEPTSQMTIKVDVCPWESGHQDEPQDSQKSGMPLKAASLQTEGKDRQRVNICPWETEAPEKSTSTKTLSQGQERQADVCPWDSDQPEAGPPQQPKTSGGQVRQETVRADVCPWDTDEARAGKSEEQSEVKTLQRQTKAPEDVYPWDSDQPEAGLPQPPKTSGGQVRQETVRADVCPWDTDEARAGKSDEQSEVKTLQRQTKAPEDVCPWDSDQAKAGLPQPPKTSAGQVRQETVRADVCPWDTDEARAGKSEEPNVVENLERQKKPPEDVCPWETEAPKTLNRQDSSRVDVCPWETEDTKVAKKQENKEEVCPWDAEVPKVLKKQDSSRANVCPWETDDPNTLKKQDSGREEVCPWETDDSKVLKKQDSARAEACPWETEDPKVLKRQDSVRADVCPWETDEPKELKKQDSGRADVCPWETEEPGLVKGQDSSREVCPWESNDPQTLTDNKGDSPPGDKDLVLESETTASVHEASADTSSEQMDISKENLALGRRDALCPWEMGRTSPGSFTDNNSDVFTWEPENIPEEEEEDDDAECAAEALVFPPDL